VGLAEQHEKSGLKSIIDVGFLAEQPAANAADHRPMPLHQGGEGGRVPALDEPRQQIPVISSAAFARAYQLVQVPHERLQRLLGHGGIA
jgi:hypothetical protein